MDFHFSFTQAHNPRWAWCIGHRPTNQPTPGCSDQPTPGYSDYQSIWSNKCGVRCLFVWSLASLPEPKPFWNIECFVFLPCYFDWRVDGRLPVDWSLQAFFYGTPPGFHDEGLLNCSKSIPKWISNNQPTKLLASDKHSKSFRRISPHRMCSHTVCFKKWCFFRQFQELSFSIILMAC